MRLDNEHSLSLARPEDSDAIATGTFNSIQAEQHGLVLASSPNYANYVKYLLDNPQLEPSRRHFVVRSDSDVVGYIDLRRTDSNPHLNHIWISASRRGTGVGGAALCAALSHCAPNGIFDLNVVAGNSAQRWYENLGMKLDYVDRWYVRPALPAPALIPSSTHMISASLSLYGIATAFHPSAAEHVDLLQPHTVKISLDPGSQRGRVNIADRVATTYPAFTRVAEHIRDNDVTSAEPRGAHLVSVHMSARLQTVVEALRQ